MSYDDWLARPYDDDDPEGDGALELDEYCPDCGASDGEPCEPLCGCALCRRATGAPGSEPPDRA